MGFDEEPEGDPHGECAQEIRELQKIRDRVVEERDNARAEAAKLLLQLSEARDLLQEGMSWIGVDPSAEEAMRMNALEQKILDYLGKTEKRKDVTPCKARHSCGAKCQREKDHCGAHFINGIPGHENTIWSDEPEDNRCPPCRAANRDCRHGNEPTV